ncbi:MULTISPECIES: hypothetical protein [unclassified Streptomyces]|uniref:hypothetical protein n=1 Tax=unclassified Streptomyces TaxID=2593676 RepID=UPI0034370DB2
MSSVHPSASPSCRRETPRRRITPLTNDTAPETATARPGAERDQNWAGSDAESIHRNRYLVAERIYLDEVDPLPRMDAVIGNAAFDRPRLLG